MPVWQLREQKQKVWQQLQTQRQSSSIGIACHSGCKETIKIANGKGEIQSAPTKWPIRDVPVTPEKFGQIPMRKQSKNANDEPNSDPTRVYQIL